MPAKHDQSRCSTAAVNTYPGSLWPLQGTARGRSALFTWAASNGGPCLVRLHGRGRALCSRAPSCSRLCCSLLRSLCFSLPLGRPDWIGAWLGCQTQAQDLVVPGHQALHTGRTCRVVHLACKILQPAHACCNLLVSPLGSPHGSTGLAVVLVIPGPGQPLAQTLTHSFCSIAQMQPGHPAQAAPEEHCTAS